MVAISFIKFYLVLIKIIIIINAKIQFILVQNVSSLNHNFGGKVF